MVDLPEKGASLIDWYLAVVDEAGLSDKRYPVKGMNVWTPLGFAARRALDAVIIRALERSGSVPVEFPTLIPQSEFQKEKEHIKGFDQQVYWVTRGGSTELEMPLVLRPTSETAMYPIFALWVRSHKDLPLTVYQVVNTFRYETKTTRPFLRVREIHFIEEHTCQLDEAAATGRVAANLASFAEMAAAFALPYVAVRRPEWDKFPGAYYSVALDIPIGAGRTLQIGSIHHYRENFARPYGIGYETADGERRFVHQTTFGLSERLLGAIVATHGDQKGAVFPSATAPYEVVVVPIAAGGSTGPLDVAREILGRLTAAGVRATLDDADERPGAKYYRWELRGVPLRLDVGRREAEGRSASAVDRLGRRRSIPLDGLEEGTRAALREYDLALAAAADARFRSEFEVARSLKELAGSTRVRVIGWCGEEACGHAIETAIDGALLGTPEGPFPIAPEPPGPCIACGRTDGVRVALAARPI
ncbi:MAG TPA: aminoacyl--tRNA ligase-related protein [Thermoplasmata archaeon]|nr:aminoacyl--tRNA ligase-related protein [Thermoplasmata archaeon]